MTHKVLHLAHEYYFGEHFCFFFSLLSAHSIAATLAISTVCVRLEMTAIVIIILALTPPYRSDPTQRADFFQEKKKAPLVHSELSKRYY